MPRLCSSLRLPVVGAFLLCLLSPVTSSRAQTGFTIPSGSAQLQIQSVTGGYGVRIQLTNSPGGYEQVYPMAVEVVDEGGAATWVSAPYSAVEDLGGEVYRCRGNVTSANGSVFGFTDTFRAPDDTGTFKADRSVVVATADSHDRGFSTRLALRHSVSGQMSDHEFFMPSVWYGTNAAVGDTALAHTMTDDSYWVREDRLPLPLFMLRERASGMTFAVIHQNPNGGTFAGEDGLNRIIDGRMQFASLGMENNTQPLVGLVFPGTEGERTLVFGASTNKRWALRSHPVTPGFAQSYSLVMRLTTEPDFPTAMEQTWTAAHTLFNPATYNCDLNVVYSDAVNVLDRYWMSINAAPGEPFRIPFPSGIVSDPLDYNYQMGFVGMQLPNAAILIRGGLNTTNSGLRSKGEQMVDWWASHSLTTAGCPKTWYDPHPQTWRSYPTYLRVACDGMIGMLRAWNQEQKHGISKSNWLNACIRFGDWLISRQNADGSIARSFDPASNAPVETAPGNTSHMIRYLTELYLATGSVRFKHAALSAGDYIDTHVYRNFSYVGGTPDNANVPDKEAASMALRAFTALYDLTREVRWRDAAVQTAHYYATWIYSWNIPIPAADPRVVYPLSRQTTGLSIIATGNGGCDSYAATDAFEVYRLYLFTGDTRLLDQARMMLYNTKQPLDWDSADPLGYGDPGLFNEALTLVVPRGHGVDYYLPWQTANYMEPMIDLSDAFGSYSIDAIEQKPWVTRQAENKVYSNNRGYVLSQLLLSATSADGQVTLDWTPATNAASYRVRRATVAGGPYETVATVAAARYIDTNVVNGTRYHYAVSALTASGGAAGTSGEVSATPAKGLAARYPFDGNTLDVSGAGNDGINNGVTFVPGAIGTLAGWFDGGSHVQLPCSIGQTNFTVALWVSATATGGTGANWWEGQGLVDAEVGGWADDFGTALLDGKFVLGIGNPDTTLATTQSVNDGQWHHVAATWNVTSGATQLYVDGVPDNAGNAPTGVRSAPTFIQIGKVPTGAFFNGAIDDVLLFNRSLQGSEIAALANPPAVPTGLSATAGGVQVALHWSESPGATRYHLKRSLANGGPYTVVAGGLTTTNFVDTNVWTGVTVHYVVSAANGFHESANSDVASATPQGPPLLSASVSTGADRLTLSWPDWATGYQIQMATNLVLPVIWWPVTNTAIPGKGLLHMDVPLTNHWQQLFRLATPWPKAK